MKWGRKKSSPSPSPTSIITRVFPVSWFSKFKQKDGTSEISSVKKRGKLDFPTPNSSCPAGWRQGRFYSVDGDEDDAFWRLSFRKEGIEGGRSRGAISPLWFDSDDEFQVPVSGFKSFGLREMKLPRREDCPSSSEMVSDIKKVKEKQHKENILRQNGPFRRKKSKGEAKLRTPRKKGVNDRRSRKLSHCVVRKEEAELERGANDGDEKSSKPAEREIFPIEPETMDQMKEEFRDSAVSKSRNQHNISFPKFSLSSVEEDYAFASLDGEGSSATSESASISAWQNLEDKKYKEMKVETESQGKSGCISKKSHRRKTKRNRAKAYSPSTECRIRVLEDMKKARMKLKKKKTKDQVAEGSTVFNSFAVIKSSFNPQQDFRDSMVAMITEERIRSPEELEELLACYLTMNCDGYHDLIIKVFQEVWLELNEGVYRP